MNILGDLNFKNVFQEYKDVFFNSKKYWLIYLILIILAFVSLMDINDYNNPKLEIISFIVFSITGIFLHLLLSTS